MHTSMMCSAAYNYDGMLYINAAYVLYINAAFVLYINAAYVLYINAAFVLYINAAYMLCINAAYMLCINAAYMLCINAAYMLCINAAYMLYINAVYGKAIRNGFPSGWHRCRGSCCLLFALFFCWEMQVMREIMYSLQRNVQLKIWECTCAKDLYRLRDQCHKS